MQYARKRYLDQLIRLRDNGRVKVITGLRRCGKSYLLFTLYREYLEREGVEDSQIIGLSLDDMANLKYRNPFELDSYVREKITDTSKRYYVFLDEIQFVTEEPNPYVSDHDGKITFIDVVLGLMKIPNADIYVTGSNSRMLSSDVLTQFRDRGDEIRVYPLSYAEVYENYGDDKRYLWRDYITYGGMPLLWSYKSHEERSRYLRNLLSRTYIKDVLERHRISGEGEVLETVLRIVASGIGSLTNTNRISNTFLSERQSRVAPNTISRYLDHFLDAFLLRKAERYDVKGRKYIRTPSKYYFTDVGLRNALLGFRQLEETHLMENVLYNELVQRGYDVDVGIVEYNTTDDEGKKIRKQLEVDFVVNRADARYYIQSALSIEDPEKRIQETASLLRIPDSFRKIVVVKDYVRPWQDERGIQYVGIEHFLLHDDFMRP